MDAERLAFLDHQRRHAPAHDALLDVEGDLGQDLAALDHLHDVPAAEAVGDVDEGVERPARRCGRGQRLGDESPTDAVAVDAVPDHRRPDELHRAARRQPRNPAARPPIRPARSSTASWAVTWFS